MSRDLRDEASYLHTALLLGLLKGEDAVAWADRMIHEMSDPPHDLIELSLTAPEDLSSVRHALAPLAHERVPEAVMERTLRLIADEHVAGRRAPHDSLRVLTQLRRLLPLPAAMADAIRPFENEHMLASVRIGPSIDEVESRLGAWLVQVAEEGGAPEDPAT